MERIALHTRLKPGFEETYDREHETIPAVLEAEMREYGVHSWRIWRDGVDLFHFIEVDDYAALQEQLKDSAANQAWQIQIGRLLDAAFDPTAGGLPLVWKM